MCQSLCLLCYALNRGPNESCERALFNSAYFPNVLVILLHDFPFHQS